MTEALVGIAVVVGFVLLVLYVERRHQQKTKHAH